MLKINKYSQIILEEMYLDQSGIVRRKNDGYLNRFSKHDEVVPFVTKAGYAFIQVPQGIRDAVPFHHVVWILNGKNIPQGMELDHVNENKLNNDISNLRLVTRSTNSRNRKMRNDNTSGVTGIRWSNYHNHWVIRKTVGTKRVSRNRKTLEEALLVLEELTKADSDYTERHGK